jgi:hypothetical protein
MQGWSWMILKPAKAEAKKALSDIAKDEMPDGDWRDFVVIVKDKAGSCGSSSRWSWKTFSKPQQPVTTERAPL